MVPLNILLDQAKAADACEVLIMAGDIPAMRVNGTWMRYAQNRYTPGDVETLVRSILPPTYDQDLWRILLGQREIEFAHASPTGGTFQCNAHFQRGSLVLLVSLVDDSSLNTDW